MTLIRSISSLLIAGCLTLPGNSVNAGDTIIHEAALIPSTLVYSAKYNGLPIEMTRKLTFNPSTGIYQLSSLAKSFLGKVEEIGRFEIDPQGELKNHYYKYERSIFGNSKTEELIFDYQDGVARYTSKDKERQVTLDSHFQSRISYQLQLQRDLLNNCEDLSYKIISRGKPRHYEFVRHEDSTIDTPLGEVATIVVKRIDDDRETTLWLAPALNYTLIRLAQKEDGEEYQIELKEGAINQVPLSELLMAKDTKQSITLTKSNF